MPATAQPTRRARRQLTDSGLETELLFLDGIDLPDFAAFPLLARPRGPRPAGPLLPGAPRRSRAVPGCGTVLETPTWRASSDWGARLGYDAAALAAVNADAVALVREAVADFGAAPRGRRLRQPRAPRRRLRPSRRR